MATFNKNVLVCLLMALAFVSNIAQATPIKFSKGITESKKNIILLVSDGMGTNSMAVARTVKQQRDGLDVDNLLLLDNLMIGQIRTRSASQLITDSAAAGTTFAIGEKTNNGYISVTPDGVAHASVLEALKLKGYKTGLVVTTRITDATPAVFASHVKSRNDEDLIAEQELGEGHPLGSVVDLIIGGGRCHFHPEDDGGCREDDRNLIEEATAGNWTYVGDRAGFDALDGGKNVSLPLLGLLAEKNIPYSIDRDDAEYPSLAEQTKVALKALSDATADSEQGFFIMIESSRIDHTGHDNDAPANFRETLDFDDAIKEVISFVDETDTDTLVISTSDHETGGLSLGAKVGGESIYQWYPQVLLNASHSGEYLVEKVSDYVAANNDTDLTEFLKTTLEEDLGILDYTDLEVELLKEDARNTEDTDPLLFNFNNLTASRSHVGWTTEAHTQADVNVYAYSNSEKLYNQIFNATSGLRGSHENTEVAHFIANLGGVNLTEVTEQISGIQTSSGSTKRHLERDYDYFAYNHRRGY